MSNSVEDKIILYLKDNFPQIRMHGGVAEIVNINEEEGVLQLKLGGQCNNCSLSSMTIEAIENKIPNDITKINTVNVEIEEINVPNQESGIINHEY